MDEIDKSQLATNTYISRVRRAMHPSLLLVVDLFFAYRAWDLGEPFHLAVAGAFMLLGTLALANIACDVDKKGTCTRLETRWQGIAFNIGITIAFLDIVFAQIEWTQMGQHWRRRIIGRYCLLLALWC